MSNRAKSNEIPKSDSRGATSRSVEATLTFQLPEAEELLELAIQARRWRDVIQDIVMDITTWKHEAKNPEECRAFHSVTMMLRDRLADEGLTLQTHEQLQSSREERRKRRSQYWNSLFKKANENWRDIMKAGEQSEESETTDGNHCQ